MERNSMRRTLAVKSLSFSTDSPQACNSWSSLHRPYSPVTDLAMNMTGLSAGGDDDTPRKGLQFIRREPEGCDVTPNVLRPQALKHQFAGTLLDFLDSPSSTVETSTVLQKSSTSSSSTSNKSPLEMKSSAFRRFQQMSPVPLCDFDPSPPSVDPRGCDNISPDHISPLKSLLGEEEALCSKPLPKLILDISPSPVKPSTVPSKPTDEDETSQDSGVSMGCPGECEFKFPTHPAPRPRFLSKDLCFSPTTVSGSPCPSAGPMTLNFCSPGAFDNTDDGFHELLSDDKENGLPQGMSQLIRGPMLSSSNRNAYSSDSTTPCKPAPAVPKHLSLEPSRRGLFRSPSAPKLSVIQKQRSLDESRKAKRGERDSDDDVIARPVLKRRKSVVVSSTEDQENKPPRQQQQQAKRPTPRTLQRCQSEVVIKSALSRADSHSAPLIGDCSQEYCLPLCPSKHQDLKGISPDTLAALLDGQYNDVVDKFLIVDCRYPYEFEGGHIQSAENLYTKTDIFEKFLKGEEFRQSSSEPSKRNIVIFHCEFSSERGPKMSRFLRNKDRDANKECYPSLHYPEVYLLEGGYKCFWEQHQSKCTKNGAYKPMLDKAHSQDLKTFRAKSKTWAGEECGGRSRTALKVRF